jgi:hypothetical protein
MKAFKKIDTRVQLYIIIAAHLVFGIYFLLQTGFAHIYESWARVAFVGFVFLFSATILGQFLSQFHDHTPKVDG